MDEKVTIPDDFVSDSINTLEAQKELTNGEPTLDMPDNHFWVDHRYYVLNVLGEGAFGTVFLVFDNITSQYRALKMARSVEHENLLNTEIEILQQLSTYHDLCDKPMLHMIDFNISNGYIFDGGNELVSSHFSYFITEYADMGDLGSHVVENNSVYKQGIAESEIFHIFGQIVDVVSALHSAGFLHLDLKPDNILLNSQNKIFVSDFALSKPIKGEDGKGNFIKYRGGSKSYWSPEMFLANQNISYNGVQSDIFAMGIILFILTFGSYPFLQANVGDFYFQLLCKNPVEFWNSHPDTHHRMSKN